MVPQHRLDYFNHKKEDFDLQIEIAVGDLVTINDKVAAVTEVLDASQSKRQRCWIKQDGKAYCVLVSDLKPYKG